MIATKSTMPMTVVATLVVALELLCPGCGPEATDVDKAANYTPDALAQELILRYRAPQARYQGRE